EMGQRLVVYKSAVMRMIRVAVVPFVVIGVASPYVFDTVFGDAWVQAGFVSAVLAPFFLLQLISGATVSMLDVLELHWERLCRELVFLASSACSILLAIAFQLTFLKFVVAF